MDKEDNGFAKANSYIGDYTLRDLHKGSPRECIRRSEYFIEQMGKLLAILPKNPGAIAEVSMSLFEQKETLEKEVRPHIEDVGIAIGVVDREIKRCRENLTRIETDGLKLRTEATRWFYEKAAGDHMRQYTRAVDQRKNLREGLGILRSLLKDLESIRRPGHEQGRSTRSAKGTQHRGANEKKTQWKNTKEWIRDNEDRLNHWEPDENIRI